ncbi:MAG TPA: hypothetical protein VG225_15660 [Terracidiphilus sp.]|nr:hypothetical protein [Terracidiphilus sp.]
MERAKTERRVEYGKVVTNMEIDVSNVLDKDAVARALADAHRAFVPAISRIVRVVGADETERQEPVKLLEVNPETSASGIVPIAFGPDPPQVPFPSVVIEVTEAEFESIRAGRLPLPDGWRLADQLYPCAA